MLYLDYQFDISPNGIMLDEDLTLAKLPNFRPGDVFVLEQTQTGRLILRKKENLEKLFIESAVDKKVANG